MFLEIFNILAKRLHLLVADCSSKSSKLVSDLVY